MKPIITDKFELRDVILAGKNPDDYNYSSMSCMLENCKSLEEVFFHKLIDYSDINSPKLEANYPEFFLFELILRK